jgi:hypothetical protein
MDIEERTPEQVAAIEARKIFLMEERKQKELDRMQSARRRSLDPEATARKLVEQQLVSQAWVDRKTPKELRHYVRVACIAFQTDAISKSGAIIPVINIMHSRRQS